MFKLFTSIFLLMFLCSIQNAFAKQADIDPLYLYSEPLDSSKIEQKVEVKDPRTLNEKVRAKLHLKPTKKIYLHNIDKSNQPVTIDDYYKMAADKKRSEFEIPKPIFEPEKDIILPDPKFRVIRYNTPPGQRNFDVTKLVAQRRVSSPGILSPDKTKMVYTQAFFYPQYKQTGCAAYYIPVKNTEDAYDILYNTNVIQQEMKPIVRSGMDETQDFQFMTLYPIDWSIDGTKIAFKEKIGSNLEETWKTNIVVYDFERGKVTRLSAVREAIIYWWRQNKQIELKDYMWDIYPIGWSKEDHNRLIVYAYAYTNSSPLFLGTWSIDYNNVKSKLESINSTEVEIDLHGLGLKQIKLEN